MFKRALACASLTAALAVGSVNGQQPPTAAQSITQAPQQRVQIPGTGYEFVLGSFVFPADGYIEFPLKGHDANDRFLTALVTWISDNFDIPADYHRPRIVPMSSGGMTKLPYGSFLRRRLDEENQIAPNQLHQVISLYSVPTQTIYLHSDWTGQTPAELSMLVHEMVHHLQNLDHRTFGCRAAEEELPYEAEEKWLNLFGLNLASEFGLDRATVALTTGCME